MISSQPSFELLDIPEAEIYYASPVDLERQAAPVIESAIRCCNVRDLARAYLIVILARVLDVPSLNSRSAERGNGGAEVGAGGSWREHPYERNPACHSPSPAIKLRGPGRESLNGVTAGVVASASGHIYGVRVRKGPIRGPFSLLGARASEAGNEALRRRS